MTTTPIPAQASDEPMLPRIGKLSEALYEEYPAMSAVAHEHHVKEYAKAHGKRCYQAGLAAGSAQQGGKAWGMEGARKRVNKFPSEHV